MGEKKGYTVLTCKTPESKLNYQDCCGAHLKMLCDCKHWIYNVAVQNKCSTHMCISFLKEELTNYLGGNGTSTSEQ